MMNFSNTSRLKVCLVAAVICGCGAFGKKPVAPAFDARLLPNNQEKVAMIAQAVETESKKVGAEKGKVASNSLGKPLMLGTKTGKPTTIMIYLIDEGRVLWSKDMDVKAKPTLLYDTIVVKQGEELAGLKLESGAVKWQFHPEGWDYFGAAQEGQRIFITLGIGGECRKAGMHRSRIVALNARTGGTLWERETSGHCLGAPTVHGGYVFLPFDMQSISVLTADSGIEEARILSLDDNFTFVASFGEGVYYGSRGLYRFDKSSYTGLKWGEFELEIRANDPVLLTMAKTNVGHDITLYRSKGGAPPGYEDKPTPLGRWEMGQDRFLELTTNGDFKVENKKKELTTLQKKGTVFLGGAGKYTIDGDVIRFRADNSSYYRPPLGKIPGSPELYRDRISPVIGITNARDKIRLAWAPGGGSGAGEGGIDLLADSIFLLYYRFIFSFDKTNGELRWAYRSRLDVEDVSVGRGGVFIADRKGDITCLDLESGKVKGRIPTGKMITAASFDIRGYEPSFPPIKVDEKTIRQSLVEMILDKDNRLVPVRQFALGYLAGIEEPEVTRDLLTIYMDKTVPQEIKTIARQRILERDSGASYIIEALKFHYDYLNEISPPPVGVAAQALVKMDAKEGVLPLLQHLMDHETPLEDLREVAMALLELGNKTIVPTVSDYLVRYHSDSAFKKDMNTLYVLAEVVHKYGGVEDRELLRKLQNDPTTVKALSNHIKNIFDMAYQKELAAKVGKEGKGTGKVKKDTGKEGKVYQSLTQGHIKKILGGHKAEFAPCVQEYLEKAPTTSQVRMKFILNNKGRIENLMTLPNDPTLSSCLMSVLSKVKWPKIRQFKQTGQYVIAIKKPKEEKPEWPPQPQPQPQPQPEPQPEPPAEWLPQPEPLPLPQPEQPLPQPETQPEEPELPQPEPEEPPPEQPPGFEEYPDVLPEDLPGS